MTIKTLEFIHRLLIDEEAKTKRDYESARKLPREYKAGETLSASLMDKYIEHTKARVAAENALENFESHEW